MVQIAPTMSVPALDAIQPLYEITEADRRRQADIAYAWAAYNGRLEPPLRKLPGEADDNVMTNRCQAIVDRGIDFLFGKELEISVEEGAPQEAQDLLDKIWGRKETRIPLLQKLAMNGAMSGQAFLRIMPVSNGSYRLVVVDPSTVFTRTAPQDCETVLLYCIEYSTHERLQGYNTLQQVFYREEIKRIDPDEDGDHGDPFADVDAHWEIQHWSRVGDRGKWTPAGPVILWPYSFPPIFSCQNLPVPNDFWGTPDLTSDLIGVNASLNLVQSNINRINKLYGAPIIYATGTAESSIDIKPGHIIGLPLSESKIVAVALQSDIANALAFAANLRSDIDEQSSVPGVATGRISDLPRGQMSGIALELLFMPLIKKTDKKRCNYGQAILDVSRALLILNGFSGDIEMTLNWSSALPNDDLQDVQAAVAKQAIGVSNITLQRELGYDPDEEMALSQQEDQQKILAYSRGMAMAPPMAQQQQPGQPGQPQQPMMGGANEQQQ